MAEQAAIEEVCRPVCRLSLLSCNPTRPLVFLKDGNTMVTLSSAPAHHPCYLFLIDIREMKDRRYALPQGEGATGGITCGADGKVYFGTRSGRLYSFETERELMAEVARPFVNGEFIWGAGASTKGRIYLGVYPTGEFCEYDIRTGSLDTFTPMPGESQGLYARQFVELPGGNMFVTITGTKPAYLIYDPDRKTYRTFFPESLEKGKSCFFSCPADEERLVVHFKKEIRLLNWKTMRFEDRLLEKIPEHETGIYSIIRVGTHFYGVGVPSGSIYRIQEGMVRVVKDDIPYGNLLKIHSLGKEGEFVGLGDNGLVLKFNLNTKKQTFFQIRNESNSGMQVHMLEKICGKSLVIGSNFNNLQIFRIDLSNYGCKSSLNKISGYGGQVNCGTYLDNVLYLASYNPAVIYALNPEAPFDYGVNPRVIGRIEEWQNRPVGMVNDGRNIYIATKSDYGTLGGAITAFDPVAEKNEVYRNFVPYQNPNSLFHDPASGCLIGTTEIFGDCHTHRPRAENSVVFIWDPQERRTIHTSFPWKTSRLTSCDLSPEGELIGFEKDSYFVFDTATKTYEIREWSLGTVKSGIFLGSRDFCGAAADRLFRLYPRTNEVQMLGKTSGTTILERISDREFLFNQERGVVKKLSLA